LTTKNSKQYSFGRKLSAAFALILTVALMSSCSESSTPSSPSLPNILVISTDDLGNQLGSYGDTTVATPHLDELATAGTRFTRAYVTQPSCSSSRSSFFSGLYPHQNGQIALAHLGFSMTEDWPLLPKILQEQRGYFTALAGKLHVGPSSAFRFFDMLEPEHDDLFTLNSSVVAHKAKAYFSSANNSPFYVQFDLRDPHRPFHSQIHGLPRSPLSAKDVQPFSWTAKQTASTRADIAAYYNSVSRLDSIIGDIILALRESGQYDNTLILFWSDNGPAFLRAKTRLFEQGTKVPLIIAGPGVLANQSRDELVSMVDILPTVLNYIGVEKVTTKPMFTGRDIGPLLSGKTIPWRDHLFTETNFHTASHWSPARAVTNGRWKLIEHLSISDGALSSTAQLYDLEADPDERNNVAGVTSNRVVLDELATALLAWRTSTEDPLLEISVFRQWEGIKNAPSVEVSPWYKP